MSVAATLIAEAVRPQQAPAELLFQPYKLGAVTLPHRIVMAPLTRSRARQPGNVPTPLNARYYAQRASAALIISEATQVSMQGQGYAWTPGAHSREQVEGWRLVTDAVHEEGGRIFLQLWHVGRISHPSLQPDNMLPVAPSAITPAGEAFMERGFTPIVKFLAENGADVQAKDANGRTPLDLAKGVGVAGVRQAAREPFPETVALLESLMAAPGIALSSAK